MKEIVEKLKQSEFKDVLIVGDVMLDEYVFGAVNRISPEAPVPVLKEERREWSLGGAANVALNCKRINCKVKLIGIIGDKDDSGKRILSMLEKKGIITDGVLKSSTRVTTCKRRIMAKHHQLMRNDLEDDSPLSSNERAAIIKNIDSLLTPNSIVVVSDYAKGVIDNVVMQEIIAKTSKHGCMVLVDPKGPDFSKYKGAAYMKPNFNEFKQIVDFFSLSQSTSMIENARRVCDILDLKGIIITRGEEGITFVSRDKEVFIPSIEREVFDLTGAGDTVIAFLSVGLLSKLPVKDCLILANKAASVAISHVKTYAVSLDELTDNGDGSVEKYYQDLGDLKVKLDRLKLEHKRVVFTNGCFDILHAGHIHILREAKKHGDLMIVALNTDASVKRFKGEGRPLKPLNERAIVMSALGMVDFVVAFDEDTPLNLIKFLEPDVLVKGVDYKPEEVVGYKEVKAYGGDVVVIGWKNKHSTTSLINKFPEKDKNAASGVTV